MLILLIIAIWIFPQISLEYWILGLILLGLIGFFTFGPHMLIVTALPMDLGTKEKASSAAGFIDCFGYIGAGLTGVGTGLLLDRFNWDAAFYFWLSGAVVAAILLIIFWKLPKFQKAFKWKKVSAFLFEK